MDPIHHHFVPIIFLIHITFAWLKRNIMSGDEEGKKHVFEQRFRHHTISNLLRFIDKTQHLTEY